MSDSELGELLINAKKAYYVDSKPIMDDHTYDTLEEILRQKNPHHRLFSKVGSPNFDTGFTKKRHDFVMGSQNKANKYQDLVHYFELKKSAAGSNVDMQSISYVVQPKCDGISLEIVYKNGQLVDAITRGDGRVGDIITQNVVKMKNLVVSLPNHFTGSIRCEIVVTLKDFEKLNQIVKKEEGIYSNPRNAASGISQRLDSLYSEFCTLLAVDIFSRDIQFSTEMEKVDYLTKSGLTVVETHLCQDFPQIEKIYQDFLNHKRDSYSYEIDGLVIKINDLSITQKLGYQNQRPKFQVAYKFPADTNQTQILGIDWQTGPMGLITPVAKIEPIKISGAIITFASLANFDLIRQKNINLHDIVEVSRRGDVIPYIEKVITKVTPGHLIPPTHCSECHSKVIVDNKYLRCPNKNCPAQMLGTLRLFCANLDILGISQKTIQKLVEAKLVTLPGDFYRLTPKEFINIGGLGLKSGTNIVSQIQAKKNLTLLQVFHAAAIPNFSHKRIKQVIDAGHNTTQQIFDLTIPKLTAIPGFKETLAQKIIIGLTLRRPIIDSILKNVTLKKIDHNSQKLSGLSFCITGTLSSPRKDFEKIIEDNGGAIRSSVSKDTSYLISNQKESASSKYKLAKKFNVPIITELDFAHILGSL
jgi:DNA ligase (NAD+)